ncbi:MAG: D-glycerate dehydrogenase [Pseudomonadota bacterium]
MNKVCVARRIPQAGLDLLAEVAEVVLSPHDRVLTREELTELCQGCRALVPTLANRIDREFLLGLPELRLVANVAVGYDNIDLAAARELGVMVSNTPGVLTDATADLTILLMLALLRRLVEGDQLVRSGQFHGMHPLFMLGSDPRGKVLGIYGMGRIGEAVALRALPFGMKIIYHNRTPRPEAERELGAEYVSFDELLAASDVLSINAPLNDATRGAFNYQAFKRMQASAYLVNTGRGPIVEEEDLVRALNDRLIRGAALDVYQHEPKIHPGLLEMPNVILSPHLGSATIEARTAMATLAASNVVAFFRGHDLPTRVV